MNDNDHDALVLRELPVPWLVERLAPVLLEADREGQQLVEQHLLDEPMPKNVVFGFEHWLSFWNQDGRIPYETALLEVVRGIGGTKDLKLFSKAMTSGMTDLTELLWFLLNGVAEWAKWSGDPEDVGQDAAWVIELFAEGLEETVDWPKQDPLGVLFAFLYSRFRESTSHPTMPVPSDFTSGEDQSRYFNGGAAPYTSADKVLLAVTSVLYEPDPKLSDVLGDDARIWPKVAANIGSLRRGGLLSTTTFQATPSGRFQADLERDRGDRRTVYRDLIRTHRAIDPGPCRSSSATGTKLRIGAVEHAHFPSSLTRSLGRQTRPRLVCRTPDQALLVMLSGAPATTVLLLVSWLGWSLSRRLSLPV